MNGRDPVHYVGNDRCVVPNPPADGSRIKRVSEGADFLGYIVRPGYVLSRKRVVNNLKYKLALFRERMIKEFCAHGMKIRKLILEPDVIREFRQTLASYLGHFKHANAFNLVNSIFTKNLWLREYLIFHNAKLIERFKYRGVFRSLRGQVHFFRYRLRETIVFFKIGNFLELYDDDVSIIGETLGLKARKDFRGMQYAAGFPVWLEEQFVDKVLSLGRDLAIVDEGMAGKFVKERYVREIYRVSPLTGQTFLSAPCSLWEGRSMQKERHGGRSLRLHL